MKIIPVVDRALTGAEMAGIERFRKYTEGVPFACIADRVMVMLDDVSETEAMTASTRACMQACLDSGADGRLWGLKDGHCMLEMPGSVFGFSASGDPAILSRRQLAALLQTECIFACEAGEIIAFAYEED